ncbi:MAG: zinc ribbon domain-containing protein [Chloroflexi bacterium]|nr:zinc ribbon domain-containing protein [Chloroflexota bacterium]
MPIYEFDCDDCGSAFDKLVRMSAIDDVTCPECGSGNIHKKMSTFASKSSGNGSSVSVTNSSASCAPGGG